MLILFAPLSSGLNLGAYQRLYFYKASAKTIFVKHVSNLVYFYQLLFIFIHAYVIIVLLFEVPIILSHELFLMDKIDAFLLNYTIKNNYSR